jgi:hypothetical protein
MVLLIATVVCACAFALLASVGISWASRRSPLWNIGLAVVVTLVGAAVLLFGVMLLMRQFEG